MIGKTISHYRILEKLGEGGMGVVYKAEDTKLKRTVALKFLPSELTRNPGAKSRFIQEAQAASALNHPNICTIYEIDEIEDQSFIAMEYVEGKTLGALLKERELPLGEALDIAIRVTEGLSAAHRKGIVHRDIKPDNVMVTGEGLVKIMDFGLAKLRGLSTLTKEQSTLGTLSYMSPEQVQGLEADQRSDVFSVGVVLYEMVTGRRPFRGEHEAAIIYSVLNEAPEPLARYKSGVPDSLQVVIDRALAKDRDKRYQRAEDMMSDLKAVQRVHEPQRAPTPATADLGLGRYTLTRKARLYVYAVVAIVAVILTILTITGKISVFPSSTGPIDSIAVLPLENLSGDVNQEYFSDGMTDALITELSKIKSLRVISRTSVMRFKKTDKSLPEIAAELKVKAIVEGSVFRSGENVRINVQLIQASPEKHLWADSFEKPMGDILALQSDVARAIAREVQAVVTPEEEKRLASSRPVNPEAHEAYLKGRFYWNKRTGSDLETAVEYFKQAIEKDSTYALAYTGLAMAYDLLPGYAGLPPREYMLKAEAAARKALQLDPTLAEAHTALGSIMIDFHWDWASAEAEYKRAIELDPNYPTAHHWYSTLLGAEGRFDEALAEAKRAQELDPLSLVITTNVGSLLNGMGQYDKAIDEFKKTLELDPNFVRAHSELGWMYVKQGKFDEAIAEFMKARALSGSGPTALAGLGYCYARSGNRNAAERVLSELFQLSKQGYSVPTDIAIVYYGLGDKDKTFEWLDRAYQVRSSDLLGMKADRFWDGLRSDPRFAALAEKIGPPDK